MLIPYGKHGFISLNIRNVYALRADWELAIMYCFNNMPDTKPLTSSATCDTQQRCVVVVVTNRRRPVLTPLKLRLLCYFADSSY